MLEMVATLLQQVESHILKVSLVKLSGRNHEKRIGRPNSRWRSRLDMGGSTCGLRAQTCAR